MTDRRALFAVDGYAAEELRGVVEAESYVIPSSASVFVPSMFLHAARGGPRDRQLLFGDRLDVLCEYRGWTFVRAMKDGYCGWARSFKLGPDAVPTHSVRVRHTYVYGETGFKRPPVQRLPFSSGVMVRRIAGRWAETPAGWIYAEHLREISAPMEDPVAVASMFLGAPYLWAGNTGDGIDCSGLVQVACLACGIPCPGDSDQQEAALGTALAPGAGFRRGDLLFWRGHVAWVADAETLLHANAHTMTVAYEQLGQAIARIEAQGDGGVTSYRRI